MAAQRPRRGRPAGTTRYVSQSRNIVLHVYDYFDTKGNNQPVQDIEKQASEATHASIAMVRTFKRQRKNSIDGIIHSPVKKQKIAPVMDNIDGFDRDAIRREVLSFYERGELPTLDLLLEKVKEHPVSFQGGRTSLWRLLTEMGFQYKKHNSSRAILMERTDIVAARNKYLREMAMNRSSNNPRPEIFLDETWVNQNTCVEKCWTDKDGTLGPKTKSGKGGRFIVLHAGGDQGFIPGALLMFRSKNGNKGDYHDSMNGNTFKKWFTEQLLPNIPPRSLIVMDNAPYHSVRLNKAPTSKTKKAEMQQWFMDNSIPYDPSLTRTELLVLANTHKQSKETYEIDELARAKGHKVVRLPPYYCQFNPIELIWGQVKEEVKKKNSNEKQHLKRVEELTRAAVEHVSPDTWRKCIEHTHKLEADYATKEIAFEHMYESFIIELSDSDTNSNGSDDSSEDNSYSSEEESS